MKRVLAVSAVLLVSLLLVAWDDEDAPLLSITAGDLKTHVDFLADDALEGREAGSAGGRAAAEYIADRFEAFSLEAPVDGSYFQEFGKEMRNVVGLLRGSDPDLGDEVVIVGGHYDHVGTGKLGRGRMPGKGDDTIWNGADDNASGTAGVLELAQAFSLLPEAPRRSVLFILFDAEERGLVGSWNYKGAPVFPLEKTVTMMNLDMIGRAAGKPVSCYGTWTGEGFQDLVRECNQEIGIELSFPREMTANSDHFPFAASDIPVLFFFTGIHSDYHRPSDHADKIKHAPMEQITRLSFLIRQRIANDDARPVFQALPRRPARPQRLVLGVFGKGDAKTKGYKIDRILRGSNASRVGLKVGDAILQIGESRTPNGRALRAALRKVKKGETVKARILRNGEEIILSIPFGPRKRGWY